MWSDDDIAPLVSVAAQFVRTAIEADSTTSPEMNEASTLFKSMSLRLRQALAARVLELEHRCDPNRAEMLAHVADVEFTDKMFRYVQCEFSSGDAGDLYPRLMAAVGPGLVRRRLLEAAAGGSPRSNLRGLARWYVRVAKESAEWEEDQADNQTILAMVENNE